MSIVIIIIIIQFSKKSSFPLLLSLIVTVYIIRKNIERSMIQELQDVNTFFSYSIMEFLEKCILRGLSFLLYNLNPQPASHTAPVKEAPKLKLKLT